MDSKLIQELLIVLFVCSIFLILVFVFFKIYYAVENEKRIKNFALDNKDTNEISIADGFLRFCYRFIKNISKLIKKSSVCHDYAKRFDKYLIYNDTSVFNSLDYISIKFLIMIFIQVLYFISSFVNLTFFNFYSFLLISLVAFFILDGIIIFIYRKKKNLIEDQLLQAISIMNSAFKSGKNILQAIDTIRKELPSPIKDEFNIIYTDIKYGLELSVVFERFYNRVKLEEAKYITSSLTLLSKTGGNIVTVFNMIEKNFYNRLKIKNELKSLTSTSKFLYIFLLLMPWLFVLIISMLNPSYFLCLFTTKIGFLVDLLILIIYFVYILVIKRIMKVDEI